MKNRRSFTREFKLAAVKKVLEKGLTVTKLNTNASSAIHAGPKQPKLVEE